MQPEFATKIEATRRKFQHTHIDAYFPLHIFKHVKLSGKANRFEHLGYKINSNKKEAASTIPSTQLRGLQTPCDRPTGQGLTRQAGINQTFFHTQLCFSIQQDL